MRLSNLGHSFLGRFNIVSALIEHRKAKHFQLQGLIVEGSIIADAMYKYIRAHLVKPGGHLLVLQIEFWYKHARHFVTEHRRALAVDGRSVEFGGYHYSCFHVGGLSRIVGRIAGHNCPGVR